jgi:hypothetical protein
MYFDEEKLDANEQGEHIVRRVIPVKDLHGILQGECLLQAVEMEAWTDGRLRQEGVRDRCFGCFCCAGVGVGQEVQCLDRDQNIRMERISSTKRVCPRPSIDTALSPPHLWSHG